MGVGRSGEGHSLIPRYVTSLDPRPPEETVSSSIQLPASRGCKKRAPIPTPQSRLSGQGSRPDVLVEPAEPGVQGERDVTPQYFGALPILLFSFFQEQKKKSSSSSVSPHDTRQSPLPHFPHK